MNLSIIIPTLNEVEYLPLLLQSIRDQSYVDYEIIVADAGSTDGTEKVAVEFGAQVVEGGMPAVGRNCGAEIAQGEFFLFLDADVILPVGFLENIMDEIEKRFIDLATCEIIPLSELPIDHLLHQFTNLYIRMSQFTNPHAPGFCIAVSKRLFRRIGGFDEGLTLAEDHEFVKRAAVFRPLRILESASVTVSVRRLVKEGRFVLVRKYLQVELYRAFMGEPRTEIVNYEFGRFAALPEDGKGEIGTMETLMKNLQKQLIRFGKRYEESDAAELPEYQTGIATFTERFDQIKQRFTDFLKNGNHAVEENGVDGVVKRKRVDL